MTTTTSLANVKAHLSAIVGSVHDTHERVVITNVSERRARIAYAARIDLPFRVRLVAPTLKLKCWTRVVWQNEGVAELEFQLDDEAGG